MDWITIVEREGHALSTAARHDFTAEVPSCPGWDVNHLLSHIAVIHHRVGDLLRNRSQEPFVSPEPPSGNLLGWYEAGLAALLDAMRDIDPAEPVWTFTGTGRADFWFRRMSHETLVHRIDAELATGAVGPIDAALAVDGIDELLMTLLPARFAGKAVGAGETVHLHAADAEGEWLVTLTGEGFAVERAHAKGDVAVRGPAADLHRWAWGRGSTDGLELFGAADLAGRFRELVTV